ncbi:MAG: hypothetical protein ACE5FG_05975 [Myxococcota bacterium]
MAWRGTCISLALVAILGTGIAAQARDPHPVVPRPLEPWVEWVLKDQKEALCPFLQAPAKHRQCAWPARLELVLQPSGGRFQQDWRVHRDLWAPLPGDERIWPEDVEVDDQAAVVVRHAGVPSVWLPKGRHRVSGRFRWPSLPELIAIPPETGLLSLSLRGERIAFPRRDPAGRLWLQKQEPSAGEESRLEVIVHRRVIDEIPLLVETRVELRASGANREIRLGPVLPPGLVALSLDSLLPARLEPDGGLRIQIRPGRWRLSFTARSTGPIEALELPETQGPWDDAEVWVFEARSGLRLVDVEGVPAIDPQQTTLPAEWRPLPAYLMKSGDRMRLVERRRGDADPAPDQLELVRTWWLDFDGQGYTLHDRIQGTLVRSWRLEMGELTDLGRAAIDGRDQLLSRLPGSPRVGLELRQGPLQLDADSRVEGTRSTLPAVGWLHDFTQVEAQLELPPGWRLLHASGVDDVRSSWITGWSLLEIFLVLVSALAVAQLWGWGWGALALLTLTLIYPEPGAPRWSWLVLLGTQSLLRAIPPGRPQRWLRGAALAAATGLVLLALPFSVQQLRQAVYPALERPWQAIPPEPPQRELAAAKTPAAVAPEEGVPARAGVERKRRGRIGTLAEGVAESYRERRPYYAPDPQALVSTGPGLPRWKWHQVRLAWRGPVEAGETFGLWLAPPWLTSGLSFVRVGLLIALALRLITGTLGPGSLGSLARRRSGAVSALVALLVGGGLLTPRAAAAEFPPPQLLEELREQLLKPPECHPHCAASPELKLFASPTKLELRVRIHVAAETAVPLPGGAQHWLPAVVLLDGTPAPALAHDPGGQLWIQLDPGLHQIVMRGPLPPRESLRIPLPLRPHHVRGRTEGWVLEGVEPDGRPADTLQLTRVREAGEHARAPLEPGELEPFARVERTLRLGLTWQLQTAVFRVSPSGHALVLHIPLLPGESVTREGVRVEDGQVVLSLSPAQTRVEWSSSLKSTESLVLTAPEGAPFSEVWRLDVAPVWHVDSSGIPPIHGVTGGRVREWRPWPGEALTLAISRPEGVGGRTFTIDRARLQTTPGLRAADVRLEIQLRANRGARHALRLPESSELQWVEIDGSRQPIRQVDREVTLPILPGTHRAVLAWREARGISSLFSVAPVELGVPSVNTEIDLALSSDRWTLMVDGPRLGPAVLFWSVLAVLAIAALGLGRLSLTPLGWGSWLLLFVGLTQVPIALGLLVAGWLLALGWRQRYAGSATPYAFDALQILLALWTLAALVALIWGIQHGLLGLPDMNIRGNGSSAKLLRWYQDRSGATLPTASALTLPLWVYRVLMLAWALWLAQALIGWLRWGWSCFSERGLWRSTRRSRPHDDESWPST